jgi:hypothetical protein
MSGKLGSAAPAAKTNTTLYTVPANKVATANVLLVNRGSGSATVKVAISTAATPADKDYIDYNATIKPGGILERLGLVCSANEKIIVNSDSGNLSARVHGFEAEA